MNSGARELQRRAYLDALGVDSYVSRYQLPGAAPTQRLGIRTRPAPVAAEVAAVPRTPDLASMELETRRKPVAAPPQTATDAVTGAAAERFCVAVSFAGGLLWLDEILQAPVGPEYAQLLGAIVLALGRDNAAPLVYQFNWPLHDNAQLDQGADAAREGLLGFVNRKLSETPCEAVVLMGEVAQKRIVPADLQVKRQVHTVSAWQMLRAPELKPLAWQDLQPLMLAATC